MMVDRSWLEMAAERRWAWPRRARTSAGAKVGKAIPLSDFVGLELVTVMESPFRNFPPTNSLPPRRCPCPVGLFATDCPETGVEGDCGGLRNNVRVGDGTVFGGTDAPGLKEKAGSAGERALRLSASRTRPRARFFGSNDGGHRLAMWEKGDGAEPEAGKDMDDGLRGKTKGGFGGGFGCGEGSGVGREGNAEARLPTAEDPANEDGWDASRLLVVGGSIIRSGAITAAIFSKPRCGTRGDESHVTGRMMTLKNRAQKSPSHGGRTRQPRRIRQAWWD
jgi:hypothetical protein